MEAQILTERYGTIKFLIDEEDKYILQKYQLYVSKVKSGDFYIITDSLQYLHRILTNAPAGLHVHHKNHNTLDNRKQNLEVLTPKEHAIKSQETRNLKLTKENIKDILTSEEKSETLADKYNVSNTLIREIRKGKQYASVFPEIPRKEYIPRLRRKLQVRQELKYLVLAGINFKILSKKYNISISDLYSIRKGTLYPNVEAKLRA